MISVTLDKASKRIVDGMLKNADKRVERGEQLFLLELAAVLQREVQGKDPKVPGGRKGRKYKYADRLRMGTIEGAPKVEASVAVWLERRGQALKDEDLLSTALAVMPLEGAPAWVNVLAGAGLWPADLLPIKLAPKEAKVVARRVRPDEAEVLRKMILSRQQETVRQLRTAGAPTFQWGEAAASGQRVYVDIAWEILRGEFGWSAAPERAAWRPALKRVMEHVPVAMRKFAEYLVDGKEGRFDTGMGDAVTWRKVKTGLAFQRTLMPFVKRRV